MQVSLFANEIGAKINPKIFSVCVQEDLTYSSEKVLMSVYWMLLMENFKCIFSQLSQNSFQHRKF